MAGTLLPFVGGIDLSKINFTKIDFPKTVAEMQSLKWFKANECRLGLFPNELKECLDLESINLNRNCINQIPENISDKKFLKSLCLSKNQLTDESIPNDVFKNDHLSVLDLSYNELTRFPCDIIDASNLSTLNLEGNKISSLPNHIFVNVCRLFYLNLSHNHFESIPPQIRRLKNLKVLLLNDNPLKRYNLKQICSLTSLETLNLRNTQRDMNNWPLDFVKLSNLSDLNISSNNLSWIPNCLFTISSLKRVDLSENCLNLIPSKIGILSLNDSALTLKVCCANFLFINTSEYVLYTINYQFYGDTQNVWTHLEVLNLCANQLKSLPSSICKLENLRKLYLDNNLLEFEGLPSGISYLENLDYFSATYNQLKTIPEGLCRCSKLKSLILKRNDLVTLPEGIYFLRDLKLLDVEHNPNLVMPNKPLQPEKGDGLEYYNIDFSLNHQLCEAGMLDSSNDRTNVQSNAYARKLRLRSQHLSKDASLKSVRRQRSKVGRRKNQQKEENCTPIINPDNLDYSDFFYPDVGSFPSIMCWEIENFRPKPLDDTFNGTFFTADCYIILETFIDKVHNQLNWHIFFWIGNDSSIDKQACSAMHAVNLRNFLHATTRTYREEQGEESEAFLVLFNNNIILHDGSHTESSFYEVQHDEHMPCLFKVKFNPNPCLISLGLEFKFLHPKSIFILDLGANIYVWQGTQCKNTSMSKARLIAERIKKSERKNKAQIIEIYQSKCSQAKEFWQALGYFGDEEPNLTSDDSNLEKNFEDSISIWEVSLENKLIELPKVSFLGVADPSLLQSSKVYIIDCGRDLFFWSGSNASKLVKAAVSTFIRDVFKLFARPSYAKITRIFEGNEPLIFKTKFKNWNDVMPVDFTRSAESIQKRGLDLKPIIEGTSNKANLSALFQSLSSTEITSKKECLNLIEKDNENLEVIVPFVLQGKDFVQLPSEEFGHFYSGSFYAFICQYKLISEKLANEKISDENDEEDYDVHRVVYLWQGRDANNIGWLTFCFGLKRKIEEKFGKDKTDIVKIFQQKEDQKFLSHFRRKLVIHKGKREMAIENMKKARLYMNRFNLNIISTRTIQIEPISSNQLNSAFQYILTVPKVADSSSDDANEFDSDKKEEERVGVTFVWIGCKSECEDEALILDIAKSISPTHKVEAIHEGEESSAFWDGIGGYGEYDTNADFLSYLRLFKCSNEQGFFNVEEKCADFCQDDLNDEDVMILDNGEHVFLWMGSRSSEIELKLAYKSAQLYIEHLKVSQPAKPRKFLLSIKGKESKKFTKCFHAWGEYKVLL